MSNQNTSVVTRERRDSLDALLKRPAYAERFQEVLGQRAPQFMSSILSVGRSLPPDTEPKSIIASAMIAATLDLPIEKNLGFAWIVPYKEGNVRYAQFQMGYKGYIQLAQRTGRYERMNSCAVNEEALCGFDEVGEPKVDFKKLDPTKPAVGYFFGWKLTNGFLKMCYWSREKVMEHAKRYSKAFKSSFDGPWKTEFDKMAIQTVVANELSDWGVLSVEWQKARQYDQSVVVDINAEPRYVDNASAIPEQTSTRAPEATDAQRAAQESQTGHVTETPAAANIEAKAKTKKAQAQTTKPATPAPAETKPQDPPTQEASPANNADDEKTLADMGLAPEVEPEPEQQEEADAAEPEPTQPAPAPVDEGLQSQAWWDRKPDEKDDVYLPRILDGVKTLMKASDITDAQILQFCIENKFAKPGQKLADLSTQKLTSFGKNWKVLMPKFKAVAVK